MAATAGIGSGQAVKPGSTGSTDCYALFSPQAIALGIKLLSLECLVQADGGMLQPDDYTRAVCGGDHLPGGFRADLICHDQRLRPEGIATDSILLSIDVLITGGCVRPDDQMVAISKLGTEAAELQIVGLPERYLHTCQESQKAY